MAEVYCNLGKAKLYCNTIGLYCDRGQGRWAGAGRAAGRAGRAWGAQVAPGRSRRWALGEQARCRRAGRTGRAAGAVDARAAGARERARQHARVVAEPAGQGWLGDRRAAWTLGGQPGRLGMPWAVHSTCFWPGSTRYFPESNFLDIVREPGS